MSASRLVLVATNEVLPDAAKGNSLSSLVRVYTPKEVKELRKEYLRIIARYEAACEKSTRLCDDIGRGLASQSEMDEFQSGEFSSAEQAYEDFMKMLDHQPQLIQASVFGWD
jgi:hypothetical protein